MNPGWGSLRPTDKTRNRRYEMDTAKKLDEPTTAPAQEPAILSGKLRRIGGSMSDDWNIIVANQTVQTFWVKNSDAEEIRRQRLAAAGVLIGISPRDEFEGMLAGQLVACHNAAMECYRRAMLRDQTTEGRDENLSEASRLSRTYATLLESLNRHRGKGAQKVTVEHVHVYKGGQAIVGNVEHPGGDRAKSEDQPHAKQVANAPSATMPSADTTRERVSVAGDAEWSMQNARRKISGRIEGE
jgi:hypothetical protein